MSLAIANRCLFSLGDTVGSVGLASLTHAHSERTYPSILYRMEHDHTYDIRFLRTNDSKTLLSDRLRYTNFLPFTAGATAATNTSSDISVTQFFRCVLSKHFTVGLVVPSLVSQQGNVTR